MFLFWLVFSAPALSEPQSKEPRPSAATMRRASGCAGRPRAASRAPRTPVRGAQTERSKGPEGTLRQLRNSRTGTPERRHLFVEIFYCKVAARGRAAKPDKAGANSEK